MAHLFDSRFKRVAGGWGYTMVLAPANSSRAFEQVNYGSLSSFETSRGCYGGPHVRHRNEFGSGSNRPGDVRTHGEV